MSLWSNVKKTPKMPSVTAHQLLVAVVGIGTLVLGVTVMSIAAGVLALMVGVIVTVVGVAASVVGLWQLVAIVLAFAAGVVVAVTPTMLRLAVATVLLFYAIPLVIVPIVPSFPILGFGPIMLGVGTAYYLRRLFRK